MYRAMLFFAAAGMLSSAAAGEREDASDRKFSITIAPLMLAWSTLDVTAEARFLPAWSVAIQAARCDERWGTQGDNLWALGAQGRYHLRSWPGFHVGAGVSWWYDDELGGNESGTWGGLKSWLVSPLAGYTYVHRTGFTAAVQTGVLFEVASWNPSDVEERELPPVMPLLRLNLGWSF